MRVRVYIVHWRFGAAIFRDSLVKPDVVRTLYLILTDSTGELGYFL